MPRIVSLLVLTGLLVGCQPDAGPLFTTVEGIDFINAIPENDSINIVRYEYIYNGGGVGVGDFDKDGNPDLVFSGNYVSSRLYLQQSAWSFTDVTAAAGLTTNVWCAGVNVHDVDGNGYEDIYFATLNPDGTNDTPNLLFLNDGPGPDGIPVFREAAAEYGIADPSYATHSAWFDYERDGDLDLYVLNNGIESYQRNVAKGTDTTGRGKSVDHVYLNEEGRFRLTDLVRAEGWGLGIAVQDFNYDDYPDIYVGNDFLSDDFLLINQRGQGLKDQLQARIPHQSRNSMGVDVADLTGDGAPEIMVVDMLPDDNQRRKTMFGDIPHQGDRVEQQRGYAQQYVRNTLQLNNGDGTFSDVAYQTGVAATDWSWTPLLADFDNDGDRDIFVSNGYPKDITNKDFIDFSDGATQFGTAEAQLEIVMEALKSVDGVHQPNYFFRNDGGLRFAPATWLPQEPSYSNGSVFVDLDRDGDLDLVTNNINEPAGLYRNNLREWRPAAAHYLQVELRYTPANPDGLGTKIWLQYGDSTLYHEHYRQRGYLSTVDQRIHFGLGKRTSVDRLTVRFPDGTGKILEGVPADQVVSVSWEPGLTTIPAPAAAPPPPVLRPRVLPNGPVHRESAFTDFDVYALALRDHSKEGPALAAIDLDGDGNEELLFGGAAGQAVSVWKQTEAALTQVQNIAGTEQSEATSLAVIPTLTVPLVYVANGSTEAASNPRQLAYDVHAYAAGDTLQTVADNGAPADFNASVVVSNELRGQDQWVFLGNRMSYADYLRPANSIVLRPDANEAAILRPAEEMALGMVTAAAVGDFNGDGRADLATVGDYTPLHLVFGAGSGFADPIPLPNTSGWYYSLTSTDLDGDGDLDLVAGNVGLNTPYRVSPEKPLLLRSDDFDGNGTVDPVVLAYNGDQAHPVVPRNTLGRQLPSWKRMLTSFGAYGRWTADDLPPLGEGGIELRATEFRSLYLENDGAGNFTVHPLPDPAQTAPLRDAVEITLADGRRGLLCVQNDYAVEPLGGRFDAGSGFVLTLDANGALEVLSHYFSVRGDARSVVKLRSTEGERIFVGINDGALLELVPN